MNRVSFQNPSGTPYHFSIDYSINKQKIHEYQNVGTKPICARVVIQPSEWPNGHTKGTECVRTMQFEKIVAISFYTVILIY